MQFDCFINGTPHNVPARKMNFKVDGVPAGIVGHYVDGIPYQPDREQFRAALPYRWRQAFDREGGFWFTRDEPGGHISLSDYRGRYLATVYILPAKES